MAVPISQSWTVAKYVISQKLAGKRRYPLVLMLEPLFRCNLACAGCGKIQHPKEILKRHLTPDECFQAVDECGAPMVSIPGGEPLLHPQIKEIVDGLVARKKYIYLCTNAILLEKHIDLFKPSKYLSFSIHIDGLQPEHDHAVCREGVFEIAVRAIKLAISRGFRVTTNTTLFNNADPARVREMFDFLMDLGVEGMMVSPGYEYELAPDQAHFLKRSETSELFTQVLSKPKRRWQFNQSPLFMQYLMGNWDLECTPWGSPAYNLFGWQKPCYLLNEGQAQSFDELMTMTNWDNYGRKSGNPKCANCMVHCGHEPSAVNDTFFKWRGFVNTALLATTGWSPWSRKTSKPSSPKSGGQTPSTTKKGTAIELPVLSS